MNNLTIITETYVKLIQNVSGVNLSKILQFCTSSLVKIKHKYSWIKLENNLTLEVPEGNKSRYFSVSIET